MDFNVNVNVKFDATPALVGAVSTLAGVLKPAGVSQPVITAPAVITSKSQILETAIDVAQKETAAISAAPILATVDEQATAEEKSGEITDEMLRKIVGPVSKSKGKDAVFKILAEFGVSRVPDLKQEQRQAFIDKINAL